MDHSKTRHTTFRHLVSYPLEATVSRPETSEVGQLLFWEALDALPHQVWVGNGRGDLVYANSSWQEATGAAQSDWLQALHAEDAPIALRMWQQALHLGTEFDAELRLRQQPGEYRWSMFTARFRKSVTQPAGHWFLTATDVHQRVLAQREMTESLGMQKSMLDASVDCIKILNLDGTLAHMNQSGCVALGVAPDSGFGMVWLDLLPESIREHGQRALKMAQSGRNARFAGMSEIAGQPPMHWDNILTPVTNAAGRTTSILCVSRDITLQREAERRLRIASESDALTGLPNRRLFNTRLKQALNAARSRSQQVGLMLLDLDHFKHINDTLGHPAGDHLLRVLARRLQANLPANGFVARLGGDEFAVVLHQVADEQALSQMAEKLRQQISAPITYTSRSINGGMSIGCALYPRDAPDASGLMKSADTALHDLKAGGRGGVRLFGAQMMLAAETTATQLQRARELVQAGLVTPHYQPKVRLDNRQVIGFEALLRWHTADGQLQLPHTLEAAFKDYELATKISDSMRSQVFSDMSAWLQAGLPVVPVSLNASPVEFLRDDFSERLLRQLDQYQIPVQLVEIEVTEHMLGDRGADYVIRALRLLKSSGVRIALDDFGTGHSSLAHLRDYPVDCLKIDRDFVQRVPQDPTLQAIVRAVVQLGPSLSLDVVAEGIETEEQCQVLQAAGCLLGQGFLFGHAESAQLTARRLCALQPRAL